MSRCCFLSAAIIRHNVTYCLCLFPRNVHDSNYPAIFVVALVFLWRMVKEMVQLNYN